MGGSSVVHCAALNYRPWRLEIPWMGVGRIMVGWSLPVDYWCDSWTLARLAGVGLLQSIGATLILQGWLNDTWVGLVGLLSVRRMEGHLFPTLVTNTTWIHSVSQSMNKQNQDHNCKSLDYLPRL